MNLSTREWNLFLLTLVAILVGSTWMLGESKLEEWSTLAQTRKDLDYQRRRSLGQIGRRDDLLRSMETVKLVLPQHEVNRDLKSDFLQRIQTLADKSALTIRGMEPEKEKGVGGSGLFKMAINASWSGGLKELVPFLFDLQTQGVLMDVRQLNVKADTSGQLKGNLMVDFAYSRGASADAPGPVAPVVPVPAAAPASTGMVAVATAQPTGGVAKVVGPPGLAPEPTPAPPSAPAPEATTATPPPVATPAPVARPQARLLPGAGPALPSPALPGPSPRPAVMPVPSPTPLAPATPVAPAVPAPRPNLPAIPGPSPATPAPASGSLSPASPDALDAALVVATSGITAPSLAPRNPNAERRQIAWKNLPLAFAVKEIETLSGRTLRKEGPALPRLTLNVASKPGSFLSPAEYLICVEACLRRQGFALKPEGSDGFSIAALSSIPSENPAPVPTP